MGGFLIQCIRSFGFTGIFIYLKVKLKYTRKISIPGIKAPLSMRPTMTDRITFKEIFMKREYDVELSQESTIRSIIDAGANIGFTSIFLANRFPHATILSIEPDDENFRILEENVKPYSNIRAIKGAIWHQSDRLRTVDKGYGKRGITIEKNEAEGTLDAFSIGDLMNQFGLKRIDLLKMDIEGSEKEVFEANYETWLPKTSCLIIELHDRMKKGCSKSVMDAIGEYDFSLSIRGENLVFTNNDPTQ